MTAYLITPATIEYRVNMLTAAWNELRNYALGKGTKPLVSATVAELVGRRYEEWRAALAGMGPMDTMLVTAQADEVTVHWWRTFNAVREVVDADKPGAPLPIPEGEFVTVPESVAKAAKAAADAGAHVIGATGGLLLGAAALAWVILNRKK
jgi:hypothetical protein